MMKIGDKVERVKGEHFCGMKVGDRGTVVKIIRINGEEHIGLKEYPGTHSAVNFTKVNINPPKIDVSNDINWDKVVGNLSKMIKEEETRRKKLNSELELQQLISQRDKLDARIKELENKEELLDKKYIDRVVNKELNYLVDIKTYRKGNVITCKMFHMVTKRLLAKGEAKCMPGDKFDINIGVELAYYRCMQHYFKKQMYKTIDNTY